MERIILRHLSGSKSQRVDELPIADNPEVTLGRDPSSTVSYDAQKDDLVSRNHARITRDPSNQDQFILHDLGSRNGTFVNKQRVTGQTVLTPGDVVQFGAGGPEFQFDLDPRPNIVGATREADAIAPPMPSTRESQTFPATAAAPIGTGSTPSGNTPITGNTGAPQKVGIGKQTLEREIGRAKSDTRSTMLWAGAGLAFAAALIVGFLVWSNRSSESALNSKLAATQGKLDQTQKQIEADKSKAYLTADEVAKKVVPSVVFIKMSWKLIDTDSGGIVYHQYMSDGKGNRVPVYVLNQDGSYQPWLTLDSSGNKAIGGSGGGSGFVVTDDGFILTNRHVAAPWYAPLALPAGVVIQPTQEGGKVSLKIVGTVQSGPQDWIPADALEGDSRRSLIGKALEGRNDYLEVTFPKEKTSTNARLIKASDEHDVALIKVDLPSSMPALELNPDEDEAQQGKPMVVVGYPFAGELGAGVTAVHDQSGEGKKIKVVFVPEPTVTTGTIARVIEGGDNPLKYMNIAGDVYQHTAGTNPGNSGGPVLDMRGRVIGIHYAGIKDVQGANFAVPIRYGIKLMGGDKVKISTDDDDDNKKSDDKSDDDKSDKP
jgi:S1-C subfamily serine protease